MHQETILVVDDNPEILILIKLMLAGEDLTVHTADSARDALEALSCSVPDAMLTDIQMPDVDGLELIRQVRLNPRTKGISILAVSANAMKENIQEAFAAGCDAYITKPLDTRTFHAWVREQLKLRRSSETGRPKVATASEERLLVHGEFLVDCMRQLEQLLASTKDADLGVWRDQACGFLHQCAGKAGVLGYPQIATLARRLETKATWNEPESTNGLRELSDLLAQVQLQAGKRAE
jgi:two-component system, cell cycle response regulator DivK